MSEIGDIMRTSAVIPVLVIDDAATARPLAEALVAGGLRVLEVTLRTPAALDAIRAMKQVPGRDRRRGHGRERRPVRRRDGRGQRVHRLARPDRAAGRADHRQRRAVPARHRQRRRHHARARSRPDALQVLPGRGGGRPEGAQERSPRPSTSANSARPAASPKRPRPSGWRSTRCCASAAAGSRAARWPRSRPRRGRRRRCANNPLPLRERIAQLASLLASEAW